MLENYLKMSIKVLFRKKFFTAISLFGISFTILVLIVTASIVEHAVNPGGPQVNDSRTLYANRMYGRDSARTNNWRSSPGYRFANEFAKKMVTPELVSIAALQESYFTYVDGVKMNYTYRYTDGEFWKVFKFNFLRGKPFTIEDNDAANKLVILQESTAKKYFGNIDVIGKSMDVAGKFYKVAGVVEDVSVANEILYADMWVPIKTKPDLTDRIFGDTRIIVLAESKDDYPAIHEEFLQLTKEALPVLLRDEKIDEIRCLLKPSFERVIPEHLFEGDDWQGNSTNSVHFEPQTNVALIIMSSVLVFLSLLFMALPSINLININLSRMVERNSEIGVRKAFGASSKHLVGQFITENLILTSLGGVISLALSFIVIKIINSSESIPNLNLQINLDVFIAGFFICIIFGVLSGVYPAYKMSKMHPVEALSGGEK